jgi:hypothetical protein
MEICDVDFLIANNFVNNHPNLTLEDLIENWLILY